MKGYQNWVQAQTRAHPWVAGGVNGLITAVMIALVVHPNGFVPVGLVLTAVVGFVALGFHYRGKRGSRPSDREIMMVLGVVAGALLVLMVIQSYPR